MKIIRNVGGIDRIVRAGLGVTLVYVGFFSNLLGNDHVSGTILGAVGTLMSFTAIFSYCPAYLLIGFSSAPASKDKK